MIEFRALGTPDLRDDTDGHEILSVLAQPKRVGLLAYIVLATGGRPVPRDTLLSVFWPESSDDRARHSLNQAVFALRRALGQNSLVTNGGGSIRCNDDLVWCDAREFRELLAAGEKPEALTVYGGSLLEGLHVPGAPEFERWLDGERSRLRDEALSAATSLIAEAEAAGNPSEAVEWARKATALAPYDESVQQRLLRNLLHLGNRAGAIREYETFASRLVRELGFEPSTESEAIYELAKEEPTPGPRVQAIGADGLPVVQPLPPRTSRSRARTLGVATAAIGLFGAAGFIGVQIGRVTSAPEMPIGSLQRASAPLDPRRVLIADFENHTSDPELEYLGRIAADWISRQLTNSGLVRVVPIATVLREVPLLQAELEGSDSRALASTLAYHTGAGFFVQGVLGATGDSITFGAQIIDTSTGTILGHIDGLGAPRSAPMEAVEEIGRRVVGASAVVADQARHPWPMAGQSPSLEAYAHYAEGLSLLAQARSEGGPVRIRGVWREAAEAFLRAAQLDSSFTLSLIWALEAQYINSDSVLSVLQARRSRLPRLEQAILDYHVALRRPDLEAAYQAIHRVVQLSPGSEWIVSLAIAAFKINRPREALETLTQLDPERGWVKNEPRYWLYRADARMLLGDYEGALQDIYRGRTVHGRFSFPYMLEVDALAALGRVEQATERAVEILETTGYVGTHYLRWALPQVLTSWGLPDEARRVAEVGLASLERLDDVRPNYIARTLVAAGRYAEARRFLNQLDGLENNYVALTVLAYTALMEQDTVEAFRLSEAARTAGEANPAFLPFAMMSQVEVAAHVGDRARSVRLLREAFARGLPRGRYVWTRWNLTPLYGYRPFEDLMRPRG
jgi:DNA-binding SARP family transcriptional activator/TolB-like protein